MCLYSKTRKKLIAEEDIPCYKVLIVVRDNDKVKFLTPYRRSEVKSGEVYGTEKTGETWSETYLDESTNNLYYAVGKGFYHTYKTVEAAKKPWIFADYVVIAKAFIPKGTEYFVGSLAPGKEEDAYASSAVRYEFDEKDVLIIKK